MELQSPQTWNSAIYEYRLQCVNGYWAVTPAVSNYNNCGIIGQCVPLWSGPQSLFILANPVDVASSIHLNGLLSGRGT